MAEVVCKEVRGPMGMEAVACEWRGEGSTAEISVYGRLFPAGQLPRAGQRLDVNGIKVRVIEVRLWAGTCLVMRDGPLAIGWQTRQWLRRALLLVKPRIILTLAVWRLADHDEARTPRWRDIRLFKRMGHDN